MSIPSMPLFCGDYLKDTTDLTLEEHGAYLMILMITWATGGKPLPDNDVRMAKRLSITKDRWANKLKPVLAQFFDLSGGTWRNQRLEQEWNYVQGVIAKRREAGAKGGSAPRNGPNGPDFQAPSREKDSLNGDANHLKDNETSKANGSDLLKQNGSTHTHTSTSNEVEEGGGTGAPAREVSIVVGGLIGLPASKANVATVEEWLTTGYHPQLDIYPAVVGALPTAKTVPGSFAYFTAAIGRHHAARINPPQEPSNVYAIRSPAQQRRGYSGCATGSRAQVRLVAREFEIGDFDPDGSGIWAG